MGDSLSVVVGVLTFRRPELIGALIPKLLSQIAALPTSFVGEVLVIDNDPAGSARSTVEAFPDVRYVLEPRPGIAAARQRCLEEAAKHDLLQFIDDDEEPIGDWLTGMVAAWDAFGRPAAVAGRVVPRFTSAPSDWISAGGFFVRRRHPSGHQLAAAPAGNLLLDIGQVRTLGAEFDVSLGLRGGEDTLFTLDLVERGGRIVFTDDAAISDLVPAERLTREWVLRRAWFHGSIAADVKLRRTVPAMMFWSRGALVVGGIARAVIGGLRAVAGALTRDLGRNARGWRLAYRGLGMAAGAAGRTEPEYGRAPGMN